MYNNSVVARLKPGVSVAQARGELGSLVKPLAERYPPILREMAAAAVAADVAVHGRGRRQQPPDDPGADGRGRHRAADRLRRRRQPDADARRLASARACGPLGARRQPGARRAPAAHRRFRARGIGGAAGPAARLLDDAARCWRWPATRCRAPRRSRSTRASLAFTIALALSDAAGVRRRAGVARGAPLDVRGAQGRRTRRLRGTRPAAPARVAGRRAVRAGADAVGRRRAAASAASCACSAPSPGSGPNSVVTASVHAAARTLYERSAGQGVLPAGGRRGARDPGCRRRRRPAPIAR